MNRRHWRIAAALLGLTLFSGCAGVNNACCEPREGLLARWFGWRHPAECPCVETGRVTVTEGPVIPEPGYIAPGVVVPTMPPPTALPNPNPLAQPVEAGPVSKAKDAGK
jgi:hypothetical protein